MAGTSERPELKLQGKTRTCVVSLNLRVGSDFFHRTGPELRVAVFLPSVEEGRRKSLFYNTKLHANTEATVLSCIHLLLTTIQLLYLK